MTTRNPMVREAMHEAAKDLRRVADELDRTADDERYTDIQAVLTFADRSERAASFLRFRYFLRDFLIEQLVPGGPGR